MAYTAEITSKSGVEGKISVSVKFTDGVSEFGESFVVASIDDLKGQIRNRLAELDSAKKDDSKIAVGPIDVTPEAQTQERLDRLQFDYDFQRFVKVTKAIELGLITGQEPEIVEFMDRVRGNFKTAYIDLLN